MSSTISHSDPSVLPDPNHILDFWFSSPSSPSYGSSKPFWFSSTPALDSKIRTLFKAQHDLAAEGKLDSVWTCEPRSTLALILLLDQVPRNIFRDTPRQYATDPKALATAKLLQSTGFYSQLSTDAERKFAIMPFSHSENIEDQSTAVRLYKPMAQANPSWYEYAEWYYKIIKRFGRFPHRNAILSRDSTEDEIFYLQGKVRI